MGKNNSSLNVLEERVPPHNLEAEMALLGAALLSEDAALQAVEEVRAEFFYKKNHAAIYEAIQNLLRENQPCDLITLTEYLNRHNSLKELGDTGYLAGLIDLVPTPSNITHYIKIVKDHYIRRTLIDKCSRIITRSYQLADEVDTLLDSSEQAIFQVAEGGKSEGLVPIRDLVHDSFEKLSNLTKHRGGTTGLPSGLEQLDRITSGFQPSDLVIIASRPSMGKTSLACSIARHLAITHKTPIAFFSAEMSREQLVQRLICIEARVNLLKFRSGFIKEAEWNKLTRAAEHLSESKIFIDDTPGMSTMEIRAKARRLAAREKIAIIFIDYLQLIHSSGRYESRQMEITEISASLKQLAKELNVPVIALSQLSRAVESRIDKKPQLSDLRESGSIEQDADTVLLLVREERYNPTPENKGLADLEIAKHRNGPTGKIMLKFHEEYTRFDNYSQEETR